MQASTLEAKRRGARLRRSACGVCLGLGFALLLSAHSAWPLAAQTPRPTRAPDPFATPTPPTQAGHGENLYYVYCMPCHGDQGQGLTDEFRTRQYPPEDANCWNSGCHGAKPYENGFTLPKNVPALIGPDTLKRFETAANVYDFARRAMPFNAPGSLGQTEYLQITAFLLERNGVVPAGTTLDAATAARVFLRGAPPTAVPAVVESSGASSAALVALAGVAIVGVGLVGWLLLRRRGAD